MEEGVNIMTTGYNVVVEGAEELIEKWEKGQISREELSEQLLNLETVMVDLTKINEEDLKKVNEPTEFKDIEE
jgi:hypothetical protein